MSRVYEADDLIFGRMTESSATEPETTTIEEEIENLSHEDLLEVTQSSIKRLIASDPLLSDLPVDVTPEEVCIFFYFCRRDFKLTFC